MLRWNATPLEEINGIKFGMSRSEVRKTMGSKYREFRKNKFSKTTTDDLVFAMCFIIWMISARP